MASTTHSQPAVVFEQERVSISVCNLDSWLAAEYKAVFAICAGLCRRNKATYIAKNSPPFNQEDGLHLVMNIKGINRKMKRDKPTTELVVLRIMIYFLS
jgi:hypothetical protein